MLKITQDTYSILNNIKNKIVKLTDGGDLSELQEIIVLLESELEKITKLKNRLEQREIEQYYK